MNVVIIWALNEILHPNGYLGELVKMRWRSFSARGAMVSACENRLGRTSGGRFQVQKPDEQQ
jgi:hypothetical protein